MKDQLNDRKYEELPDNLPLGIYRSSAAGRFLMVNEKMVAMLGSSSKQELMQIDIPTQLYFAPAERRQAQEDFNETLRLGASSFWSKQFILNTLSKSVRDVLDEKSS